MTTTTPYRPTAPAENLRDVADLDPVHAVEDEFASVAPIQPRDGRDRPLIVPPGGGKPVAYQRASTFSGMLTFAEGLTTWKVRHAVHGVALNAALTARAAAAQYGERDLDAVIEEGLLLSGGSDAANFGTAFHRFTEPDAIERMHEAPESIRDDVVSFWQAMNAAKLKIVATEQFVVNDAIGVAGTFDHIVELPDGLGRVVADKKTGKFKPKEHAIQLATYAGGVLYDAHGDDGPTRTDLNVRQDLALLIHTPHGQKRTELRWIRLDRGRQAIERALWLRAWRSADDVDLDFAAGLAELDRAPRYDNGGALPRGASPIVPTTSAPTPVVAPPDSSSSPSPAPDAPADPRGEEEAPTPEADTRVDLGDKARRISRAGLEELLATAPSRERVNELFRANRDLWDDDFDALAKARVALLKGGIV